VKGQSPNPLTFPFFSLQRIFAILVIPAPNRLFPQKHKACLRDMMLRQALQLRTRNILSYWLGLIAIAIPNYSNFMAVNQFSSKPTTNTEKRRDNR
jgi:hypothetical protein